MRKSNFFFKIRPSKKKYFFLYNRTKYFYDVHYLKQWKTTFKNLNSLTFFSWRFGQKFLSKFIKNGEKRFFEKIFYSVFYDFKKMLLKKKKLVWAFVQPFERYTKRTEFLTHKLKKVVNRFQRLKVRKNYWSNWTRTRKIAFTFNFLYAKGYNRKKIYLKKNSKGFCSKKTTLRVFSSPRIVFQKFSVKKNEKKKIFCSSFINLRYYYKQSWRLLSRYFKKSKKKKLSIFFKFKKIMGYVNFKIYYLKYKNFLSKLKIRTRRFKKLNKKLKYKNFLSKLKIRTRRFKKLNKKLKKNVGVLTHNKNFFFYNFSGFFFKKIKLKKKKSFFKFKVNRSIFVSLKNILNPKKNYFLKFKKQIFFGFKNIFHKFKINKKLSKRLYTRRWYIKKKKWNINKVLSFRFWSFNRNIKKSIPTIWIKSRTRKCFFWFGKKKKKRKLLSKKIFRWFRRKKLKKRLPMKFLRVNNDPALNYIAYEVKEIRLKIKRVLLLTRHFNEFEYLPILKDMLVQIVPSNKILKKRVSYYKTIYEYYPSMFNRINESNYSLIFSWLNAQINKNKKYFLLGDKKRKLAIKKLEEVKNTKKRTRKTKKDKKREKKLKKKEEKLAIEKVKTRFKNATVSLDKRIRKEFFKFVLFKGDFYKESLQGYEKIFEKARFYKHFRWE